MNIYSRRRLLRRILGRLYPFPFTRAKSVVGGHSIAHDVKNEIGLNLYLNGSFEKDVQDVCAHYVFPGSFVIDIGANIGLHSLFFASLAREGVVLAFEPSLETFSILAANVKGVSNIVPLNLALSDSKDILDFYVASDNAYSSLKDTKRKQINSIQKVFCIDLDGFLQGLNVARIDFVKIDVEGFEYSVLAGMQSTIARYHPTVLCEIYKGTNSNQDPEKTVDMMKCSGYRTFVLKEGKLSEYERHDDEFYNYLFVPNT